MARLTVVDPATATGAIKDIFEGPLKGKHFNLFKGMANSPAALQAYLGLAGAVGHGMLSAKERETIALAVGQANDCGYCVAAHTALGKMAGLTEAETVAIRKRAPADAKLAALTRFVGALHEKKGFVGDADLAAFKAAGYGDGHVAEVVANYALNVYTNYFNHVNGTAIDFPEPPGL